jgi:hypothetical protein
MSLAIQIEDVSAVMIGGVWLEVKAKSFDLDSYEFMAGNPMENWRACLHSVREFGVRATGFTFQDDKAWISGPLTAIQAVRHG